jgi:hypothetical protein
LVVRSGRRDFLAFEVPERFDVGPGGDDRTPIVEQIEKIRHLDAADVGQTHLQQRRAAAELKFA